MIMVKEIKNYIDGKIIGISEDYLPVYDPSTGEEISKVILSKLEDFKKVIESSKKSQIDWANTTPLKRSRIISKFKNLIEIESYIRKCNMYSNTYGLLLYFDLYYSFLEKYCFENDKIIEEEELTSFREGHFNTPFKSYFKFKRIENNHTTLRCLTTIYDLGNTHDFQKISVYYSKILPIFFLQKSRKKF